METVTTIAHGVVDAGIRSGDEAIERHGNVRNDFALSQLMPPVL
jgi:hypothetical protein